MSTYISTSSPDDAQDLGEMFAKSEFMAHGTELARLRGRREYLAQATEELDAIQREAVSGARAAGMSWGQIGHALGISKQAAQQRYGR